ncbi:hypothetical protein BGX34_000436 [Mortierella sp. NVP85]|nr:hypothetical protein BGX34_000436 [Mortierella sp. NVP85]
MAIHEVLEAPGRSQNHRDEGHSSPPYKRKGSPEDSFSDSPSNSRTRSAASSRGGPYSNSADPSPQPSHMRDTQLAHRSRSPRYRQESPMPQSNSDDDDDDSDVRSYKKRRMLTSSSYHKQPSLSPGAGGPPEVMDQVRTTLKLKQQQKAIIEARQSGASSASGSASASTTPPQNKSKDTPPSSSSSSQAVTEKTPSGISVFHGSASFAALNRRPLTSPKNPKNAKSLTIFAPSYSDSSLSIHSAPLQPSHQALGMDRRPAQPLRNNQPHPLSQAGTIPQPLRSPKTAGHVKKSSRATLRAGPYTAGLENSSLGGPSTNVSKPAFMETVSNLFDAADSSRSLKYTLEEQIRKSAQLLQTLQSSGTMIESLVRGQFKELEKGVIERFESELEYLSERIRILEENQGLTPPSKKTRVSGSGSSKNSNGSSLPSPPSAGSSESKTSASHDSESDLKDGTLPTPPLNKNQDSAMDVEDEDSAGPSSNSASSSPPRDPPAEYHSSVKKLQERVASLEKGQEATA